MDRTKEVPGGTGRSRDGLMRGGGRLAGRGGLWNQRLRLDALAVEARPGDRDARERLWSVCRPKLTGVALGSGINPDDVPDLVQDALFSADTHLDSFDPGRGSFRSWLITILLNGRNNLTRSRARRARILQGMAPRGNGNGNGHGPGRLEPVEARLQINRLLPFLTRTQRTIVVLYEIGGLSAYEASLILGITPAGVRSVAREARRRMARLSGMGSGTS